MSIRPRAHTKHVLAFALIFGAMLTGVLFLMGDVSPTESSSFSDECGRLTIETHPCEGAMRISVSDPPAACSEDTCILPPGAPFTLSVEILGFPDGEDDVGFTNNHPAPIPVEPGYFGAQTFIDYGEDLVYNAAGAAADEILWPDCESATAVSGQFTPQTVNHGCVSGLISRPISTHVGPFLELSFTCSVQPSRTLVRFIVLGDETVLGIRVGTDGIPVDIVAGGSATALQQEQLIIQTSRPQEVQFEPKVNALTVFCGDPPTPTNTPTITPGGPTPTTTPTPTITPTPSPSPSPTAAVTPTATLPSTLPCGDTNGDRVVNSQDALWVLWFASGQVPFLPNPLDVNHDGVTDALDALLILWIELNLYTCFP